MPRDDHVRVPPDPFNTFQGEVTVRVHSRRDVPGEVVLQRDGVPGDDVVPVGVHEDAALLGAVPGSVNDPDTLADLELVILYDGRPRDLLGCTGMDVDLGALVEPQVLDVVPMGMRQYDGVHVLGEDADLLERRLHGGLHVLGAGVDDYRVVRGANQDGGGVRLQDPPLFVALQIAYRKDVQLDHADVIPAWRYMGFLTEHAGL